MNENQKPVTDEYRSNWDEIFKKKPVDQDSEKQDEQES